MKTIIFKRKKAFTLAEILITLGIIGVVAAMTIPALLQEQQDLELRTQFKKAYSEIYNAIIAAKASLGYMPECYIDYSSVLHSSECTAVLYPEFKKQVKIAKECASNAYPNGCMSNFTGPFDLGLVSNTYYTTAYIQNSIANTLRFVDGVWLGSVSGWNDPANFIMDINGNKGPNKWGYDLYAFQLQSNGQVIKLNQSTGLSHIKESGGRTMVQMMEYSFAK